MNEPTLPGGKFVCAPDGVTPSIHAGTPAFDKCGEKAAALPLRRYFVAVRHDGTGIETSDNHVQATTVMEAAEQIQAALTRNSPFFAAAFASGQARVTHVDEIEGARLPTVPDSKEFQRGGVADRPAPQAVAQPLA